MIRNIIKIHPTVETRGLSFALNRKYIAITAMMKKNTENLFMFTMIILLYY